MRSKFYCEATNRSRYGSSAESCPYLRRAIGDGPQRPTGPIYRALTVKMLRWPVVPVKDGLDRHIKIAAKLRVSAHHSLSLSARLKKATCHNDLARRFLHYGSLGQTCGLLL